MNIRYMQRLLSKVNEIKIIGKTAEINGVICNVAGVVRNGQKLRLIILKYDEHLHQQIENREIEELCDIRQVPETNRILMKTKEIVAQTFMHIKSVFVGDKEFEVSESENRRLNVQDGESVLFLSELLRNGWNPEGVDYQGIDMLFVNSIEFAGDYDEIPDFGNNPKLHFIMGKDSVSYIVEQPLKLVVGEEYSEKLLFINKEIGEGLWAQINRVRLIDMWVDMEKTFSDPKLAIHMTEEKIVELKKDFEERLSEICPKGMCYIVVEYECEEGISLEFHSTKYLESKPVQRSSGMGFFIGTEKQTGILGMKLKAALIQEPVPIETVAIEAELFKYYKTTTPDDIII